MQVSELNGHHREAVGCKCLVKKVVLSLGWEGVVVYRCWRGSGWRRDSSGQSRSENPHEQEPRRRGHRSASAACQDLPESYTGCRCLGLRHRAPGTGRAQHLPDHMWVHSCHWEHTDAQIC